MKEVCLTREELYDKVWSEPISILARQYEVSDVGLAKICKRLSIPVPGRGYWAKKAAGHKVRQLNLPVLTPTQTIAREVALGSRTTPTTTPEHPPRLIQAQVEFEGASENHVVVSDSLRSAHPLLKKTAHALRGSARSSAQFPFNFREPHLDIEVSRDLLTRALRVMDALIKAFTKRGWKVSLGSKQTDGRTDHKSYVAVLGRHVPFGIRERMKRVENPPVKPIKSPSGGMYTPYQTKYRDVPSGRLSLVLRSRWGKSVETSLDDTAKHRVEDRLNEFLVAVTTRAYEDIEWDAYAEYNQRNWAAEANRRAVESRLRHEQQLRVLELEEEAVNWGKSQLIASYLSAVQTVAHGGPTSMDPVVENWLSWAAAHAASLDPIQTRLDRLAVIPSEDVGDRQGK